MRITAQNTYGPHADRSITLAWTKDEDPRGWLARLIESGFLVDALAVVADPMEFGNTNLLDGRADATDRLRAAVELLNLLTDRIARLTVALRDQYGAGWDELAQRLNPKAEDPRLYTALRVYNAGRRAIGAPLGDES